MKTEYTVALVLAVLAYFFLRPQKKTTVNTVGDITNTFNETPFVEENDVKDIKNLLVDVAKNLTKPAAPAGQSGSWIYDPVKQDWRWVPVETT